MQLQNHSASYLFLSLMLLIVAAQLYILIARYFKILDTPNSRSSHSKPIIRGGGILFYLSFLIGTIIFNFQFNYLFLGVSLLAMVSYLDDILELSVKQRIPIQILSIFFVVIEFTDLGSWWLIPALVFFGVLIINCYNFIDGINGMLGLYSATIFLTVGYFSYQENILPIEFSALLVLAILVFGYFNFRKNALFFSGDIGSMTLGILAFYSILKLSSTLSAPIIVLLISVSLTDTIGTLIKRFFSSKNIFQAHREHIYEQLVDHTKFSHLQISAGYALLQLLFNMLVLFSYKETLKTQLYLLVACTLLLCVIYYGINQRLKSI